MAYTIGDRILGRWQILDIKGGPNRSGMGIVYVVLDRLSGETLAAKTFQPQFVADHRVRQSLRREAEIWLALGEHPSVVTLRFIEPAEDQPYLFLEYIRPDHLQRATLKDYLGVPLGEELLGRWAAEICQGLIHAGNHGLDCHLDLKPDNLMVTTQGHVKVTDFGLARGLSSSTGLPEPIPTSLLEPTPIMRIIGTPGYIAPELILGESESVRSDIYSFGLLLHQMVTGSVSPPFSAPPTADIRTFEKANLELRRLRPKINLGSPFDSIIDRCLAFDPTARPTNFRQVLEGLKTIQTVSVSWTDVTSGLERNPLDEARSLFRLGRLEEALRVVRAARERSTPTAALWNTEALILSDLGREEEALKAIQNSISIDARWVVSWCNKGRTLRKMGKNQDALACYRRAVECDPTHTPPWSNLGACLLDLGRFAEALEAFDHVVELDRHLKEGWAGRGKALAALGRHGEALESLRQSLDLNPGQTQVQALLDLIISLMKMTPSSDQTANLERLVGSGTGRREFRLSQVAKPSSLVRARLMEVGRQLWREGKSAEALDTIRLVRTYWGPDPELWNDEGIFLTDVDRLEEALGCLNRSIVLRNNWANSWNNKGRVLRRLSQNGEALVCYNRAVELSPTEATPWINKGNCLVDLGLKHDAKACYFQALQIDPNDQQARRRYESI